MTKTQVNDIKVPEEFVTLAGHWYNGDQDILYALASTGNITTGTIRPRNEDEGRPMTDQEWYHHLYSDLENQLSYLLRKFCDIGHEDYAIMHEFHAWAEKTANRLAAEYGLE